MMPQKIICQRLSALTHNLEDLIMEEWQWWKSIRIKYIFMQKTRRRKMLMNDDSFLEGALFKNCRIYGKENWKFDYKGGSKCKKKLDDDTVNSRYSGILSANFHLNKWFFQLPKLSLWRKK